ncbi:MAG TPA: hypothetical protein VLC92_06760 [Rhodocyclaceae bacterium]|nr:hypothetical protein [Rhodocyclaceae bacterium]
MLAVCVAGVALHAYTVLFAVDKGPNRFTLILFACASLPYLLCAFLGLRFKRYQPAFGAALAALVADGWMFHSVFIAPGSSTAALGLLFMPILNLFVIAPLGALAMVAIAKARRTDA